MSEVPLYKVFGVRVPGGGFRVSDSGFISHGFGVHYMGWDMAFRGLNRVASGHDLAEGLRVHILGPEF